MKSTVVKRSVKIGGHTTSVSLEDAFWKALKEIAGGRNMTLADLVSEIDAKREEGNLSSAIRLFILDFYMLRLNLAADEQNAPPDIREARQTG
jgi:predicted DNA-binding ribbon-helix-helix protein